MKVLLGVRGGEVMYGGSRWKAPRGFDVRDAITLGGGFGGLCVLTWGKVFISVRRKVVQWHSCGSC